MDQDPTPPPTPPPRRTSSSNPAAAASLGPFAAPSSAATRSSVRGPTPSGMLRGMSSSSPAHSHRRSYPPPMSSGRLASGSGSSSGSPSSSRLLRQQIPPSPRPARGGGRHRMSRTHALPSSSPVLSELASIRSVGAARATSQQRSEMRAGATLYGGRPLHQALPSWSAMYARSRLGTPPPSGSFSSVAPLASRHPQPPPPPSSGTLTPQPSRYFSFPGSATSASQQAQPPSSVVRTTAGGITSPAMQQQQQAKSSFTDLAPLPGGSGGIFSACAPPASQQPEAMSSYSDLAVTQPAFHGGQPQQQAWPSCAAPPTGRFSGFATPASQQLQPSSSGVPQLPGGTFSGYPSPAMGQQPEANSSFTDLPPLPSGGGIFSDLPSGSGIAPAAASQQQQAKTSSFTTLAPLPGGSFSGLTPGHGGETAVFGSNSWSSSLQLAAAHAASDTTMYGHGGQPSSSDSESVLPPLPPTLQIRPDQVMQFSQPAGNDDSTFSESEAARMHRPPPPVLQVKKEPVDMDDDNTQLLHEPQLITVDDNDDDDEISALLNSFWSPNEPGSLGLDHTSTELDMPQQHGGAGVGSSSSSWPSILAGAVEGSGQSWKAMLTPYDNQVTTGASIPWNCDDSYSTSSSMWSHQQQIPQQGDLLFCTGVSDVVAPQYCQPSENNILSGFGQQQLQPNLQMVPTMLSATDLLQLVTMPGPSIWSAAADSSGQGAAAAAAMPAAASADMFGQMSVGQGWPEAAVAANQYAMFDTSAWAVAVPDQMASKFDQMSMGEGSLGIGQGWPATPAVPTFGITGSSSSAWASMPWNSSTWTMENYSNPGPEPTLGLGATMEQPRLTTPRRTMPQRGAHGDFFSVAEIEMIIKDKRLKELVNTDPERVKRILNNRISVAKLRTQRRAQ